MEGWSFEISTILASQFGTIPLDGHSILLNFGGFVFFSFPLALSIGIAVRVGNLLGMQNKTLAQFSSRVGLVMCLIMMIVIAAATLVFRFDFDL